MSTKQIIKTQPLLAKNICLLGKQYKIIDQNLRFVSSGLKKNTFLFLGMGFNLISIQNTANPAVFAYRGLND